MCNGVEHDSEGSLDVSLDANDYRIARIAIKKASWRAKAITGAGEYHIRLFDDDDGRILEICPLVKRIVSLGDDRDDV